MDLCYYFRKLFNNNKADYDYNILNNEKEKEICTIYCPKCGHKINYYK
jgi:hypothetical protein